MSQMGGFWTFLARARTTWLRLEQSSKKGRGEMAARSFPRGATAKILIEHGLLLIRDRKAI